MSKTSDPIAAQLRNNIKRYQELSLVSNDDKFAQEFRSRSSVYGWQTLQDKENQNSQIYKRTASLTRSPSLDPMATEDIRSGTSTPLDEKRLPYSIRTDPLIYMDELHSPLSFVRGTTEERDNYLSEEQERLFQAIGHYYEPSSRMSTFYQAQMPPSVSLKGTRYQSSQEIRSFKRKKV